MIVCSFNNIYNYFIKNKNFNDIYMSFLKYIQIWFESEIRVYYLISWNVIDKFLFIQIEVSRDNRYVFFIVD